MPSHGSTSSSRPCCSLPRTRRRLKLGCCSRPRAASPPSFTRLGVALFAAMVAGRGALPGIALGSFVSNAWLFPAVDDSRKWIIAALIGVGAALQAAAGAELIARRGDARDLVATPRSVVVSWWEARSSAASSTRRSVSRRWSRSPLCPRKRSPSWFTWWIGDAAGVITATPFLLARFVEPSRLPRRAEAAALLATTVLAGVAVVGSGYPLVYLLMPCVVWAALRFGFRGASATSLLVSLIAILAALNRQGRFRSFDLTETLLFLQVLIGVVSTTGSWSAPWSPGNEGPRRRARRLIRRSKCGPRSWKRFIPSWRAKCRIGRTS